MPVSEFDLIARYFARSVEHRPDVVLGSGDDCALLQVPADHELAVSIDTLVEGVHFRSSDEPDSVGHKALAVNLSDLAAMGAHPAWATLALTLPDTEPERVGWVEAFSRGFFALADSFGVELVGGDTTRGPLSMTLEAHGFVPWGQALRRSDAKPGEFIYVTGTLGDAGLALLAQQGLFVPTEYAAFLRRRLHWPEPRVAQGMKLRGLASAAIDISDGLTADLGHILEASGVGATLYADSLPLSEAVRGYVRETADWSLALSAGDAYELCFTVPEAKQGEIEALIPTLGCPCAWVGIIESRQGLRCVLADGTPMDVGAGGYDHFSDY